MMGELVKHHGVDFVFAPNVRRIRDMNEAEVLQKCKAIYREVVELEKEAAGLAEELAGVKERIKSRMAEARRIIVEAEMAQLDIPLAEPSANPNADPNCPLCMGTGKVWDGPVEDQVQVECVCIGELAEARGRLAAAAEAERAAAEEPAATS